MRWGPYTQKGEMWSLVAQYFNRSLLYSLGTQNNQYVLLGGLGIGGPGLNGSLY